MENTALEQATENIVKAVDTKFNDVKSQVDTLKAENETLKSSIQSLESRINEQVKTALEVKPFDMSKIDANTKALAYSLFVANLLKNKKSVNDTIANLKNNDRANSDLTYKLALEFAEKENQKSLNTGTMQDGGYLVQPAYSRDIISQLYQATIMDKVRPAIIDMPKGSLIVPKKTSKPDEPEYVGLNEAGAILDLGNFGEIKLDAKIVKGTGIISNRLIEQADYNTAQFIMDELRKVVQIMYDRNILRGSGASGEVNGLINQYDATNNAFNQTGTTLANVRTDYIKLKSLLSTGTNQNLDETRTTYIGSARTKYGFEALATTDGYAADIALSMLQNRLFGLPYIASNTILNTYSSTQSEVWLIDWSKVLIGLSKPLTMTFDRDDAYTNASGNVVYGKDTNESVIRLTTEFDMQLMYAGAVARVAQVTLGS